VSRAGGLNGIAAARCRAERPTFRAAKCFEGQATDIMLHAQEILNLKKRLNEIYVKHTGQPLQKIEEALERDFFYDGRDGQGFQLSRQGNRSRPEIPPLAVVS
jgi:ATP-dependent Clp protease protease subunit